MTGGNNLARKLNFKVGWVIVLQTAWEGPKLKFHLCKRGDY